MLEFLQNEFLRIGYFNWWLVTAYILLVSVFLYGILQPRRKSEWRSAGVAQAWIVALYAEMYGMPLTAYLRHCSSLNCNMQCNIKNRGLS